MPRLLAALTISNVYQLAVNSDPSPIAAIFRPGRFRSPAPHPRTAREAFLGPSWDFKLRFYTFRVFEACYKHPKLAFDRHRKTAGPRRRLPGTHALKRQARRTQHTTWAQEEATRLRSPGSAAARAPRSTCHYLPPPPPNAPGPSLLSFSWHHGESPPPAPLPACALPCVGAQLRWGRACAARRLARNPEIPRPHRQPQDADSLLAAMSSPAAPWPGAGPDAARQLTSIWGSSTWWVGATGLGG